MCGLVGLINLEGLEANYQSEVDQMLEYLSHRGPDDKKTVQHNNVYFAFNRLSIIDLSQNANQPFNNQNSICMSNCEIYNFFPKKKN